MKVSLSEWYATAEGAHLIQKTSCRVFHPYKGTKKEKLLVHFSPIHVRMDQTETTTMINDTDKMFLVSVVTLFQSPLQLPASIFWKMLLFAAFPRVKWQDQQKWLLTVASSFKIQVLLHYPSIKIIGLYNVYIRNKIWKHNKMMNGSGSMRGLQNRST